MVFNESINMSTKRPTRDTFDRPMPHWMKVLEERYQRLHAKVVNGTVRFTANHGGTDFSKHPVDRRLMSHKPISKRNSSITEKTVDGCDFNQSHSGDVVGKHEGNVVDYWICEQPATVDEMKDSLKFNKTIDSDVVSLCDKRSPSRGKCSVPRKDGPDNGINETSTGISQTAKVGINDSSNILLTGLPSEKELSPDSSSDRYSSGQKTNGLMLKENNGDSNVNEGSADTRLEGNMLNDSNTSNDLTQPEFSANVGNDKLWRTPANVIQATTNTLSEKHRNKMQIGGINTITRQANNSFPMKVVDDDTLPKNKTSRDPRNITFKRTVEIGDHMFQALRPLTSKEKRQKRFLVYSQMSTEARLAMKEMNETGREKKPLNTSVCFCTKPDHSQQINSSSKPTSTNDHGLLSQGRLDGCTDSNLTRSQVCTPSGLPPKIFSATKSKRHSSFHHQVPTVMQRTTSLDGRAVTGLKVHKTSTRCLPHIGPHNVTHNMPAAHARLPYIGSNTVPLSFRERTFEITPLNFDIRFHHFVPLQSENREDPPADILQQSIEKCNQWLVRYILKQ